jgi:exosome complex component RRP46
MFNKDKKQIEGEMTNASRWRNLGAAVAAAQTASFKKGEQQLFNTLSKNIPHLPVLLNSAAPRAIAKEAKMVPQITTSTLTRADGSATYTDSLFSVLAAVNGPVEVSRRDELPEEATIEVNIRPGSGVGGPRERWLESVLHSLLRSIVLVHLHPRTLVQVTLQVVREPGVKFSKGRGEVAILPTLANAAFLALVDGGLPLDTTMNAALVAVSESGAVVAGPGVKDLETCESLHAMAFGAQGGMLLDESTGRFDLGVWEAVADKALERCTAAFASEGEDEAMANGDVEQEPWLRQVLEEKVRDANAWREST